MQVNKWFSSFQIKDPAKIHSYVLIVWMKNFLTHMNRGAPFRPSSTSDEMKYYLTGDIKLKQSFNYMGFMKIEM